MYDFSAYTPLQLLHARKICLDAIGIANTEEVEQDGMQLLASIDAEFDNRGRCKWCGQSHNSLYCTRGQENVD